MEILEKLVLPLVITVIVEGLFFLAIGNRDKWFMLLVVLVNVATNLSLTLLRSFGCIFVSFWALAIAEVFIFVIEGVVYFLYRKQKIMFIWSLAANALSFGTGLLLSNMIYGRIYL